MLKKIDNQVTEWRIVDGEVVALHLDRQEYYTINPSGAVLWPLLAEGATEPQLRRELVRTFGLAERDARADVDAFLAVLRDRGLLEPDGAGEGETQPSGGGGGGQPSGGGGGGGGGGT